MEVTKSCTIDAPVDRVFKLVSDVTAMSKAFPESVLKIEELTENGPELGARYREHRMLGKKEDVIELETTAYVENEYVAMETLAGGSIWRTGWTLAPHGQNTHLSLTMQAEPQAFYARIMNFFMKSALDKGAQEELVKIARGMKRADLRLLQHV